MPSPPPSEKFLQFAWQRQLLRPGPLVTLGGARVDVIAPGTPNPDAGPDFRGAVLSLDGRRYCGDVEVHVRARSWRTHGHGDDPHYNGVILHVVLSPEGSEDSTAARRRVPVLPLGPYLLPGAADAWRAAVRGISAHLPCYPAARTLHASLIDSWLHSLGWERFRTRGNLLEERLRELAGERAPREKEWDQILYECVMEGLGYGKNQGAFLRLARAVRLDALRRVGVGDPLAMQAVLFGAAGLLPDPRTLRESESRRYARRLEERWRAFRPSFRVPLLQEGEWLFFRLRPANFPTARLAAAAFLLGHLFARRPFRRVIGLFGETELPAMRRRLLSLFSIRPDAYWGRHVHFRGAAGSRGIALGGERVADLFVNSLLPLGWLYAGAGGRGRIARRVEDLLRTFPVRRGPALTRSVERDLLLPERSCATPLLSQGALQLIRRYCGEGACARCAIGQAVVRRGI